MVSSPAAEANVAPYRPHPPQSLRDGPSRAVLGLLPAVPAAPGRARAWTRRILWRWQLTGVWEPAELVVSELSTNAVLASRPLDRPVIRLTLTLNQGELGIFVRDYCPGSPEPATTGDQEENGRGLLLVEAMSARWGWYSPENGAPGKVVWAVLPAWHTTGCSLRPVTGGIDGAGFLRDRSARPQ
jgi:anti-sigma regulatory factor (Ser/Thr protein kinase)